jgi:Type IV secretion-system coupling protein DNA-binding domain.
MTMDILQSLNIREEKNVYGASKIHQGDVNKLAAIARDFDGEITRIRPYKKSDGIRRAEDLISTFHNPTVEQNWFENLLDRGDSPDEYSFELWFSDGKLRFMLKTPDKSEKEEMHKEVNGLYPNAKLYDSDRHMPNFRKGAFVSGGEFTLKKSKYTPLRSFSGPDPFEKQKTENSEEIGSFLIDPYKSILSELIGHQTQTILFQITFRPAPFDWTDGYGPFDPSAERVAEFLEEGRFVDSYFNPRIIDPTEKDKRTAKHIEDLEESQAFEINIRYFVTGQSRKKAIRKAEGIENIVSSVYQNNKVAQQLEATRFDEEEVKDGLATASRREITRNDTIVTKSELAALAHLPNETIEKSNVDFVETVVGSKAPGSASQTTKDGVIEDSGSHQTDTRYAEVENSNVVGEKGGQNAEIPDDADPKAIIQRAEELVNSDSMEYYRSGVAEDDYPETSVTDPMPPEVEESFLEFCAGYERGELSANDLRKVYDSEDDIDRVIKKFESHIDEAFIKRTKQRVGGHTNTQNGQRTGSTEQEVSWESTEQQVNWESSDGGPNNGSDQTDLPTTPERVDQETSDNSGGWGSGNNTATQGHRSDQHLPVTQQKHPVKVVDTEYKQTRSESGNLLTMEYAEFVKERPDDDQQMVMGEDVRKLVIEQHEDKPDNDIWVGYQETGDNPFREVGIPKDSWFKHISIFGGTGLGKSTEIKNIINQVARKGYGFVVIDPKGDMAEELIRELPENRLDDIIWIEPGSIDHDKIAAINFLEASVPKDHPRYDREVESIVTDLQAVLRAEDYWGKKMEGITKNITRAMIRSENPYTLYDMYNVLINKEKRWNFAKSLQREDADLGTTGTGDLSEDIKQYSRRIAQMDEEEVDPVGTATARLGRKSHQ